MINLLKEVVGPTSLFNEYFSTIQDNVFVPKELFKFIISSKNLSFLGCTFNSLSGSNVNFSKEDSIIGAAGEFIERLLSGTSTPEKRIRCSYTELTFLGESALHPNKISLFADWQYYTPEFKYHAFTEDSIIDWVYGINFFTKELIWLPEFITNLTYSVDAEKHGVVGSSGYASGRTIEEATKSGFLELWERDAFMKFWYLQKTKAPIPYSTNLILNSFNKNEKIKILFNNKNVKLKVFDLGEFSPVEVIVTIIFFPFKNIELFSIGAAARFTKEEAIIKATCEAYQGVGSITKKIQQLNWPEDYRKILHEIDDYDKHFYFYNKYIHLRDKIPLFTLANDENSCNRNIIHFENKLKSLSIKDLKGSGINEVYIKDLSIPDLIDNLPFHVVKTTIPICVPLTNDFNSPFLADPAFKDVDSLFLDLPHCFP